MSIEKMTLVNIVGNMSFLDNCIINLINFKQFHIEKIKEDNKTKNFKNLNEINPYLENLNKIKKILQILKIPINFNSDENFKIDENKNNENSEFLNFSYEKVFENKQIIEKLKDKVKILEKSFETISHIKNLDSNLNQFKKTKQTKIIFGKFLKDNYFKLKNIEDKNILFIKQDEEKDFYWGFFVYIKLEEENVLKFFKDIAFIEHYLPNELKENPRESRKNIVLSIEEINENIKKFKEEQEEFKNKYLEELKKTYKEFKILSDSFNYRKFAVSNTKQFNICGFIPTKKINEFKNIFTNNKEVVLEFLSKKENSKYSFPVKLKTCKLFRPFEMYISTYGTPQYGSINPSSFIGLIYSLAFGVMFGDFGQGLVLLIGGIFAWKKMKNKLGLILTRCGFFSVIFGLIFDSVFGYEGKFTSFWKNIGFGENLPFHLLKPSNSIPILVISCLFGMILILISIGINIFLNIKNRKFGEALFSHNGLVGLTCYGSCTTIVLFLVFFKKNIFSLPLLFLTIIIPLILIFFSMPLSKIFNRFKNLEHKEKFTISSAIFDMIDILLSYFTNTLSFLRIGGLALSHAALMLVVMKFAKMASNLSFVGSFSSSLVVILGNAFVILLEGLIVSIQALRLIYYEIFSRFYQANGKPFEPVKINFKD